MSRHHRKGGAHQLRRRLAVEAARLMYEEDVKQYLDAKRMAARRLLGRQGSRRLRFQPAGLPSNGEIRDALLDIAARVEGEARWVRLFAMRVTALEIMTSLERFRPGLIGSVASGAVRRGSDIDVHVFTDDLDALEAHVTAMGWRYDTRRVTIRRQHGFVEYVHLHLEDDFPVELSVYPTSEARIVTRSSTDGKPIVRIKRHGLEELIAKEHPEAWQTYTETGQIEGIEALWDDDDVATTLAEAEAM